MQPIRTFHRLLAAIALIATACSSAGAPAAAPSGGPAPPQQEATTAAAAPDVTPEQSPSPAPRAQAATATAPPVAAGTPAELARQILAAEETIRGDGSSGGQRAQAGHLQQIAYRKLAENPRWDERVLQRLPRWLRPSARRNVRAQRQLSAMGSGPPPKTLPEWRIIPPAPQRELRRYYRKAQRRFGVPWQYLAAINLVESRMGRIRGTSSAGAKGPMQFIAPTWDQYGRGDIWDDHDAIMAAGRYLDARGAPGDMDRALYSYNNDIRYVRAVKAYARVMQRDARAYRGYYHWQVYYRQKTGPVWLPVGYDGRQQD